LRCDGGRGPPSRVTTDRLGNPRRWKGVPGAPPGGQGLLPAGWLGVARARAPRGGWKAGDGPDRPIGPLRSASPAGAPARPPQWPIGRAPRSPRLASPKRRLRPAPHGFETRPTGKPTRARRPLRFADRGTQVRSHPQPRHAVGRRVGSALREMAGGSREPARSRERGRPGCPGGGPQDQRRSLRPAPRFRGSRLAPGRGDEEVTRRRVTKDRRPNEAGVPITRSDAASHELRSACLAVPARPGRFGRRIGAAAGRDLADAPPVRWGSHGCRATIARSPSGARMIASGSRPRAADAESSFDHRLHPSFRCEASIDSEQRENGPETHVYPPHAVRNPSRHPRGVSAGRARAAERLPAPGAGLRRRRVFPSDRVRGRLRAPSSSPPRFGTVSRSDRRVVEEKCARARPRLSAPPS